MKKFLIKMIPGIAVLMILVALAAAAMTASSYRVLVKDSGSKYYKAKALFITGDFIFFLKDASLHETRKQALESFDERFGFAIGSMKNVDLIEVIHDEQAGAAGPGGAAVPPMYLGNFRLNAEGNQGYLYLRYGNGVVYGSVRFPGWGKGAFEPLKGLYIGGGRIRFVRSVTTRQEIERLGSNMVFVQDYNGSFNHDGSIIHGFYLVGGSRKTWEAYRIK